ncbi:hypothetical protein XELAEV_18031517mg [Xenopus laevis]|uniref:Cadherin domain-containing protein n=1 Tax=Xenopus laevis TaxID=8355 RepID=A0A974CPD5_XENLA|nr:hypothetical protein XELAEV_18031517mg [Xenopus laevis]
MMSSQAPPICNSYRAPSLKVLESPRIRGFRLGPREEKLALYANDVLLFLGDHNESLEEMHSVVLTRRETGKKTLNGTLSASPRSRSLLDFESRRLHNFEVEASNINVEPRFLHLGPFKDTATVKVLLQDADEAPIFSKLFYVIEVDEDTKEGSIVGQVTAQDPDSSKNPVRYSIDRNTDMENIFDIYSGNGSIFLEKPLDREAIPWHNITVIATEAKESHVFLVLLSITLEQSFGSHICFPQQFTIQPFLQILLHFVVYPLMGIGYTVTPTVMNSGIDDVLHPRDRTTVDESSPSGTVTGKVTAVASFFMVPHPLPLAGALRAGARVGSSPLELTTHGSMDGCTACRAMGKMGREAARGGKKEVEVNLGDAVCSGSDIEDSPSVSVVIDLVLTGCLGSGYRTTIDGGSKGNWNENRWSLQTIHDYNAPQKDNTRLRRLVQVYFKIMDINDHAPEFAKHYETFVCENAKQAQLIQTVSAIDNDEPPRGHRFYFEMVPDLSINPNFTVLDNKDNTASIFTKRNGYNRHKISTYVFPIIIFDNDYPVQSSTETLTIRVCACDSKGNMQSCNLEASFFPAGLSTGALIAILLCIIILLTLKRQRKKEPLIISKDDVRDNVVTYNDEGGGEEDTQAFDISTLRNPEARDENKLRRDIIPDTVFQIRKAVPLWEHIDVQDFIHKKLKENDADTTAPPYDSLATYAYEGNDSIAETLSSLESPAIDENLNDDNYVYLSEWGPQFKKLADMYGGQESD